MLSAKKVSLVFCLQLIFVYSFASPGPRDSIAYYCKEGDKLVFSDPQKAELFARRVLELIKKKPDPYAEATAYKILGVGPYYAGDFAQALENYLKGLHRAEEHKHWGACAMLLNEMGTLYKKQGDLAKSEKTFLEALENARRQPDSIQIANSQNNLGVVYEIKRDFQKALALYRESAEIKKRLGDEIGLSYNLTNIGSVLGQIGQYSEAEKYILESQKIRQKISDIKGIAINYTILGEMYAQKKDLPIALGYFLKSLEKAGESGYKDLQGFIYKEIAKIYEQQGRLKEALDYNNRHFALKDSLFNEQRAKQLLEMETKYKTEKHEKEAAEQRSALAESELAIKRRNNVIIMVSSVAALLILAGSMLFLNQRSKEKQLRREVALKQKLAEAELINKIQNEKERISRDLHDQVGTQLTLITTSLDNLAHRYNDNEVFIHHIENIGLQARDTMTQLREAIWAMNNESISLEMLLSKIREFLQRSAIALQEGKKIEIKLEGDNKIRLSPSKSLALFRVCQEAVNNAIKHADFEMLQVDLSVQEDNIQLRIRDDGRGFDPGEATARGYGLENMAYRIQEAGGKFSLESCPGSGTRINLEVTA